MVAGLDNDSVNVRSQSHIDLNPEHHPFIKVLKMIAGNLEAIQHNIEGGQIDIDQYLSEPSSGTITLTNPTRNPWLLTDILASWQTTQAGSSVSNDGTVTSPGAGATIASIPAASLPAGTYNVTVDFTLSGTVGAVDNNNIQLVYGSQTFTLDNNIGVGEQTFGPIQIISNGASALTLKAIAAGTVGSIYTATIIATPVTQVSLVTIQIKDRLLNMRPLDGEFNFTGMHGMQMGFDDKVVLTVTPAVPCFLEIMGKSDYRKIERRGNE